MFCLKIKFLFLILLFPLYIFSQAQSFKADSIKLVSSAFSELRGQMKRHNFKKLNWKKVLVDTLPVFFDSILKSKDQTIEPILIIPTKKDGNKIFVYTEQNGKKYFNGIYLKLVNDSGFCTGSIQTFSVMNKPIKQWQIKKDRTVLLQPDSVIFNDKKVEVPKPKIVQRMFFKDSANKPSIVALSAYYLLFNESLTDDNFLSGIYFFLHYNALLFDPFLGHMDKKFSKPNLEVN